MREDYPEKTMLMLSGGIDSTTLAYFLRSRCRQLRAIALNYGQRDFTQALQSINHTSVALNLPVNVVDIPNAFSNLRGFVEDIHDGYHIMVAEWRVESCGALSLCAVHAKRMNYDALVEGFNKDELQFYRHRPTIQQHISAIMNLDSEFEVSSPFIDMTKPEILNLANQLGVPLEKTWSCWERKVFHCGECPGCKIRKEGFKDASMSDPTKYLS